MGGYFSRCGRGGVSKKVVFEATLEGSERRMPSVSRRREFKAEIANAKALKVGTSMVCLGSSREAGVAG